MLDSASCAGMEIGAPLASVAALVALHDLLVGQGFSPNLTDCEESSPFFEPSVRLTYVN